MSFRKVTEAQIFLTRTCNINCGYCKLTETRFDAELGLEEWKKAYEKLERIGIRTVKILGGEPTNKSWLPELVGHITKNTSIKTAVLSNSKFSDEMLDRLVSAGLWGFFASVDGIDDIRSFDDHAVAKSSSGYAMLHRLKKQGVPLLAANVVISKDNLEQVPEVVKSLSEDGFYINLCSIQHTEDCRKCFSRTGISPEHRFTKADIPKLKGVINRLLDMKKGGARISIPESYIRNILHYGIDCDWQCSDISQLRIDADGGLMLCNEFRSGLADRYNVIDLTPDVYERFLSEWKVVRGELDCDGCYWSCFLQAEDNLKKGRLEFDFLENGCRT